MPFFKNTEEILKAFEQAMSAPAATTQVSDILGRLIARARATQAGGTSGSNPIETASTTQY